MKAKLITVDGMDCTGKSTIVTPYIYNWFRERDIPAIQVADLNYTPYGKELREIFLSNTHCKTADITSLVMLSCSARRELIQSVIRPALEAGKHVICDRFTSTTFVFGNKANQLKTLLDLSQDGLHPDHTVFLSLNYPDYLKRISAKGGPTDQFEGSTEEVFNARLAKYHEYFELNQKHTAVSHVDSSKPLDFVYRELDQLLQHLH